MYKSIAAVAALLCAASAAPAWGPSNPNPVDLLPCDEQITALATGIHLNIQGQYGEYNATEALIAIESVTPVNMTAFYIAKGKLESNVQTGMNLRLFNQQIAPPGNAAIPGLFTYEGDEETEKDIAEGLTGDPSIDLPNLETLAADIKSGIVLNEENLANATSTCKLYITFPPADEMGS